jgi:hypothetical protein
MKRKRILSIMLDELLEKVVATEDYIFNEFNEVEREEEDLKEYLDALSYIENVIAYYNYIVEKDGEKNENRYYDKQKSV